MFKNEKITFRNETNHQLINYDSYYKSVNKTIKIRVIALYHQSNKLL